MSVRLTILSELERVASEQEVELPVLSDDLVLVETGLDSLGFAILVARLEDALGFEPFSTSEDVYFPVTLGDFVALYEHAASRTAKTPEVTA